MTQTILNGVSRKMRAGFLNGLITEEELLKQYNRNKKEADSYSFFGFNIQDLIDAYKTTRNPLLKIRLHKAMEAMMERRAQSHNQNVLSIEKLQQFKKSALGIGLRNVISFMRKLSKENSSNEVVLILLLLEIEFANLSAKMNSFNKYTRTKIYERKDRLLHMVQPILEQNGWRYGYNDAHGKNAHYIIYVYLPNGVQLSWHTNDYYIYRRYPPIDAEWDGQACMTMDKLLSYIGKKILLTQA